MALPLLCEVEISSRLLRDLFPTSKSRDIFEYLKRISQKFRRCSHLKRSKKRKKEKHSTLKEKVYRDLYRNISHNNCRYFISTLFFPNLSKQPGLIYIYIAIERNPFLSRLTLYSRSITSSILAILFRDSPREGRSDDCATRVVRGEARRGRHTALTSRPINRRSFGPSVWKRRGETCAPAKLSPNGGHGQFE